MASPIIEPWLYATARIENEWGGFGTGFLVGRRVDTDKVRIFLVTNKHVLHEDPVFRERAAHIMCDINLRSPEGTLIGERITLGLRSRQGRKRWKEHPDDDVDVLALDVTDPVIKFPQAAARYAGYERFVDEQKLDEFDITIGEEVLIIGYPLGLGVGKINRPLVRQGIIATWIGDQITLPTVDEMRRPKAKTVRGFLVDGGVVPGSSGSPVVLKPAIGRVVKGVIQANRPAPPLLLGIVAETQLANVQTARGIVTSLADLGVVFDAETVKETVELFFVQPTSSAAG